MTTLSHFVPRTKSIFLLAWSPTLPASWLVYFLFFFNLRFSFLLLSRGRVKGAIYRPSTHTTALRISPAQAGLDVPSHRMSPYPFAVSPSLQCLGCPPFWGGQGLPRGLCQAEDDLPFGQLLGTPVCKFDGNPMEQQDQNPGEGDPSLHSWEGASKGDAKSIWSHMEGTSAARPATQLPAP